LPGKINHYQGLIKNILTFLAKNVAPIVRLSAHDEVPCGRHLAGDFVVSSVER